ncbi:MAG: hypothetical protein H7X88_02185 [Gloeobacteraceae cyanobacterium ES-bin-316]|nr:hypothetical protein [Ferruginibacter sp.]
MKYVLLICTLTCISFSCSPAYKFNQDKAAFNSSKVQLSFTSIADMNDSYFDIRENNFFEFYRQLFDSVKNTSYPGKYTRQGDTLYLDFYNKKGKDLLGSKAVINGGKKSIVFFK